MIDPGDQDLVTALRWALEELKRRAGRHREGPRESAAWLCLYRAESELVEFWRDMEQRAEEQPCEACGRAWKGCKC